MANETIETVAEKVKRTTLEQGVTEHVEDVPTLLRIIDVLRA